MLTDKYNSGQNTVIGQKIWEDVYLSACRVEFNKTVLNIIAKAKTTYRQHILELFSRADVEFFIDTDGCRYMYMHGLIDREKRVSAFGEPTYFCRFASPFIQLRVYNALTYDLFDDHHSVLLLDPLDELSDVFDGPVLDLPPYCNAIRIISPISKLKVSTPGVTNRVVKQTFIYPRPWTHFHLYAWLKDAIGNLCVVSPEFPTGNGKVDLHLRTRDKQGIIEVKSFRNAARLKKGRQDTAQYARSLAADDGCFYPR